MRPPSTPDVAVVVVSYNTRRLLEQCLESLAEATVHSRRVVVVDNASEDGSADLVRRRFPSVTLIAQPRNVGFAAAVNRGAATVRSRYVMLLNPDAELHAGSLDALVDFADANPRYGVYGGQIATPHGDLDPRSCFGLPSPWSLFCFGSGLSTALRGSRMFDPESLGRWRRDTVREVGVVSGALMLVERGLWQKLGGFDETYFMYGEDVDLCDRARCIGARPIIVPSARAVHVVGASSSAEGKAIMLFAGKATYVHKRWAGPARWWGIAMLRTGVGIRALFSQASRAERAAVWPKLWAARRTWLAGYGRALDQEVTWA